jgi:hypothetical protein
MEYKSSSVSSVAAGGATCSAVERCRPCQPPLQGPSLPHIGGQRSTLRPLTGSMRRSRFGRGSPGLNFVRWSPGIPGSACTTPCSGFGRVPRWRLTMLTVSCCVCGAKGRGALTTVLQASGRRFSTTSWLARNRRWRNPDGLALPTRDYRQREGRRAGKACSGRTIQAWCRMAYHWQPAKTYASRQTSEKKCEEAKNWAYSRITNPINNVGCR